MAYNSVQYPDLHLVNDTATNYPIDGNSLQYGRHRIALKILDATGDEVTSGVTGTVSGRSRGIGSDQFDDFTASLDLASGERGYAPILDNIDLIQLTATGLAAGHRAFVTITSSGSDI